VTHHDFRRITLAFTGVIEGSHMGHPDFRVTNKIFATLHPDLKSGMVKLTPNQQKTFIAEHPDSFAPEAGAWGRSGCTRVNLGTVDEDSLGQALTLALQNIAAKKPTATAKPAKKRAKPSTRPRK
jgi:hypothetical protein